MKIIKCPVHGYINIPKIYFELFVDTPIFQRLRSVVQTSMLPLYPSASHNRFVHSLGTYFLSSLAFNALLENTDESISKKLDLESYREPFQIAALMHDCAHSPFSHTFEILLNHNSKAEDFLLEVVDDEDFKEDFIDRKKNLKKPKEHEIFSAAIFLKHYKEQFISIHANHLPSLVARMITGTVHSPARDEQEQLENSLISLLNGKAIDIDKLDYIIRDTWASGVSNVNIDYNRLLSSIKIGDHNGLLRHCFSKSALSTIQSVVDGRNFLSYWVHAHHIVVYFQEILFQVVKKTLSALSPKEDKDLLLNTIFSRKVFQQVVEVNGIKIYLPTDGDLMFLIKMYGDDPPVNEFLSRRPNRIALWKSRAEFEKIFAGKSTEDIMHIGNNAFDHLSEILPEAAIKDTFKIDGKPSIHNIRPEEVLINLGKDIYPFTEVVPEFRREQLDIDKQRFYYIYIPKDHLDKKEQCIDKLASLHFS